MTDIEKLAAMIGEHRGFGSYTASRIADNLFHGQEALGINVDQLYGLIEGTHVVVSIARTDKMDLAAAIALGVMLDGPRHRDALTAYDAIIKAAQEGA